MLDEARDGHASRSCAGEEGLEFVADDFIEEGLLGLVTFVPVDGEGSTSHERSVRKPAFRQWAWINVSSSRTSIDAAITDGEGTRVSLLTPMPAPTHGE